MSNTTTLKSYSASLSNNSNSLRLSNDTKDINNEEENIKLSDLLDSTDKVASLQAANRLEAQYQNVYENIAQMRNALDEEGRKRKSNNTEELSIEGIDEIEENNDELYIEDNDDIADKLDFSMKDIPFPTNDNSMPIHERLMKFGSSLSLKLQLMKKAKEEEEKKESHSPRITEYAKNIKRKGTIENRLLQSRDEYYARLEELRLEKEKSELSQCRDPKINRKSKELVKDRDEATFERLHSFREQVLAKREMIKNQLLEKEMNEFRKPQINPQSKKIQRSVDQMIQWEREKQMKKEQLKNDLKKQELEQIKEPKINPVSDKLAQQMDRGRDVGEYLNQLAERKRKEREMKIKQEIEQETKEFKPQLSVHSANLQREGKVFDRLYLVHLEKESKKKETITNLETSFRNNIDPYTGQHLYAPVINQRSALMYRAEPVEDILLKKKEEMERKKQALLEKEQKEIEAYSSKVGAYSQLLVEIMEKRTGMTANDRLTGKSITKKVEPMLEPNYTFTPNINPHSKEIDRARNYGSPSNRQELLLRRGSEYEKHKKEIERKYKQEELHGCTFSPTRSRTPPVKQHGSIADRSLDWVRRKDQKVEHERKLIESKIYEECTFQPNTKRISQPNVSRIQATTTMITPIKSNVENEGYASKMKENILKQKTRASTPPPGESRRSLSRQSVSSSIVSDMDNRKTNSYAKLNLEQKQKRSQNTSKESSNQSDGNNERESLLDIESELEFETMKQIIHNDIHKLSDRNDMLPTNSFVDNEVSYDSDMRDLLDHNFTLSELYNAFKVDSGELGETGEKEAILREREEERKMRTYREDIPELSAETSRYIDEIIKNSKKSNQFGRRKKG
ncbi:hypothetical protein ABK040_012338 [Willaertia magna]